MPILKWINGEVYRKLEETAAKPKQRGDILGLPRRVKSVSKDVHAGTATGTLRIISGGTGTWLPASFEIRLKARQLPASH